MAEKYRSSKPLSAMRFSLRRGSMDPATNLLDLPDEVLKPIFSLLPRRQLLELKNLSSRVRGVVRPLIWAELHTYHYHENVDRELERIQRISVDQKRLMYMREITVRIYGPGKVPHIRSEDGGDDDEEWQDEGSPPCGSAPSGSGSDTVRSVQQEKDEDSANSIVLPNPLMTKVDFGMRCIHSLFQCGGPRVSSHQGDRSLLVYLRAIIDILKNALCLQVVDLKVEEGFRSIPDYEARMISMLWQPIFTAPKVRSLRLGGIFLENPYRYGPTLAEGDLALVHSAQLNHLSISINNLHNTGAFHLATRLPNLSSLTIHQGGGHERLILGFAAWCSVRFFENLRSLEILGGKPTDWVALTAAIRIFKNREDPDGNLRSWKLQRLVLGGSFFTEWDEVLGKDIFWLPGYHGALFAFGTPTLTELCLPIEADDVLRRTAFDFVAKHFPNLRKWDMSLRGSKERVREVVKDIPSFDHLEEIGLPALLGTADGVFISAHPYQRTKAAKDKEIATVWALPFGFQDLAQRCPALVRISVRAPCSKTYDVWKVTYRAGVDEVLSPVAGDLLTRLRIHFTVQLDVAESNLFGHWRHVS